MAATTSTSCSFFNFRSNSAESRDRASGSSKLDGMATWLINGIASAFFASMERCSCIRIATEDDGEDANDAPLIFNDGNVRHVGGGVSRRRTSKGKKKEAFTEE